ncbi:hypothetical protein [Streptomyces longisporus]|uniref:hypothetical protein n=1 Tax=Streptomyces longisporus TaxID=1948 RepID=UPI0031E1DA1A
MREPDGALALAAERGFGRYIGYACPGVGGAGEALFYGGGLGVGLSVLGFVHVYDGGRLHVVVLLVALLLLGFGALWIGPAVLRRFRRRAGGPTPRLYCFEDGVVVAVGVGMRSFGWTEVGLDNEDWEHPGYEGKHSGTRRVLRAPDGSVLAEFSGREPEGAGAFRMAQLHQAARDRCPRDGVEGQDGRGVV